MAIETHVVHIALMQVDNITGDIFRKGSSLMVNFESRETPVLSPKRTWSTEHRVIEDSSVPNSTGNPTIEDYILAEAGDDFRLVHVDQTMIITQK